MHQLGFSYEFEPVLLNALTIIVVAILFNGLFKWRRYPAGVRARTKTSAPATEHYQPIEHADFVYALSHIDTFVDVTEEDLLKIYKLATGRHVDPS